MRPYLLAACLLFTLANTAATQNLADIFTGVDTLFMPGAAPGALTADGPEATPIVSSGPCNIPQRHYSVAATYQNGRVLAIAHESLLSDNSIGQYDNLPFVTNALNWLSPGNKRVTLKEWWVDSGNTGTLQATLAADNYTFTTLDGNITTGALAATDVLILGNDWNNSQPYTTDELAALETFVAGGGAIFIAGLGWSWPQGLDTYPMNQVANLFGIGFTEDVINDPAFNVNGSPKFYAFFPDNQAGMTAAHCPSPFVGTTIPRGENLRVLRLAVSTNGEFTQESGGIAATSTLIDAWLEDINFMYGREYSVRFELIPNNDLLLFPDPATDPWTTLPSGSGGCTNAGLILSRQGTVVDSVIGAANYDISHIVVGQPFGGGCAGGLKSGVSGGLDIPVTRHEMGHQLAQSHTINHSDNTNYEPENGAWTVQGGNAQGRAHAVSYHQLADFLLNEIPDVGTQVPTGNTIPTADAGPDRVIPLSTPFTLRATATDPDAGDSLTYVWDNMNRGIAQTIPLADDSQGALFMRLLPGTDPARTFPRMSDVVAGNNANGREQLPTTPRILDIRLSVNDNHQIIYQGQLVNAGGTNSDDIRITVADAGPFVVTSQSAPGITYLGGSEQTVTWAVNGTDNPPISTQQVSIHLSTDGGFTYPTLLLAGTPNSGSATVALPNIFTETARIRVSADNNIYFDLNARDFAIELNVSNSEEQLSRSTISIHPNPARNYFQLNFSAPLSYGIQLINAAGRVVSRQENEARVDVRSVPAGLYLIDITDLDTRERVTRRVVVMK